MDLGLDRVFWYEFDPASGALANGTGGVDGANFAWSGGVLASDGAICKKRTFLDLIALAAALTRNASPFQTESRTTSAQFSSSTRSQKLPPR